MKVQFTQFSENIRLTQSQENDAKTKYSGVCKTLHKNYYENDYDGKTKYLFGSYKTKTNTRPLTDDQDVDVLFKIPEETYSKFKAYEVNGPSALLQEVRDVLNKTYTTTDEIKGWGKIVLVQFAEKYHNVEVLPAYELEDGTFIIPNSEDGGSWDKFDPRDQISIFQTSNSDTDGLTADLIRMLKMWLQNTPSLSSKYKSYNLLNDIIDYLSENKYSGIDYSKYDSIIKGSFEYIKNNCEDSMDSYLNTAIDRAQKAIDFCIQNKPKQASMEWRKIFGDIFPLAENSPVNENKARVFSNPSFPYACN